MALHIVALGLAGLLTVTPTMGVGSNNAWIVPTMEVGLAQQGANTVLFGHNPGPFSPLVGVGVGDSLALCDGACRYYTAAIRLVVHDRGEPVEQRLKNAVWVQPTEDERLTLVTCLGEYRLIVVAFPERGAK